MIVGAFFSERFLIPDIPSLESLVIWLVFAQTIKFNGRSLSFLSFNCFEENKMLPSFAIKHSQLDKKGREGIIFVVLALFILVSSSLRFSSNEITLFH